MILHPTNTFSRRRASVAGGLVVLISIVAYASPADAVTLPLRWADANRTLAYGSYSNMVGFWQEITCAQTPGLTIDGSFGNATKTATKNFQSGILNFTGGNVDGIVGPNTWNATQDATFVDQGISYPRLAPRTGSPGYYDYYAGLASEPQFYYYNTWLWYDSYNLSWFSSSSTSNSITPRGPCTD